jgi:hypothetical protein
MGCGSKTSSCVATMKFSWMDWELNAFLIRQPAEILHGASIKTQLRCSWKQSMLRDSGSGKSSLGVSSHKLLLISTARLLRLWESAKQVWRFPIKGIWGYAPLIISLANSREVLYMVNRPGNVVSHECCVPWIDRVIELVEPYAGEITLRGDTDFTLSAELDRWGRQGIKFIFGMGAHPKVVRLAEALPEEAWKPLERLARYEIATEPRRKPQRIKEAIVRFKGYPNKKLVGESVAEFNYQPHKPYRLSR